FWPEQSAIGKHVRFIGEQESRTVVGVVGDVRAFDLTRDAPSFIAGTIYVPYTLKATHENGRIPTEMTLVVRTVADPSRAGAQLRDLVSEMSREIAVSDVKPMQGYLSEALAT